jgi:hypothetical protein
MSRIHMGDSNGDSNALSPTVVRQRRSRASMREIVVVLRLLASLNQRVGGSIPSQRTLGARLWGHTTVSGAKRLGNAARALALGRHAARGAKATTDRDHSDTMPPRPAVQPPARRRRDRLRAPLGQPRARSALDLGRYCALQRCAASRRSWADRHRPAAPGRRALSRYRASPVHDDRTRRRRAMSPHRPAHSHSDPLRGLDALPRAAGRD